MTTWRQEARALIASTITSALEEDPTLADNPSRLFDVVSRAYPLKTRKLADLYVWTGELAYARHQFTAARRKAGAA